ncbi:MAG: hypothetical protein ACTSU9_04620, partial [Promethearchaeota archaeon]
MKRKNALALVLLTFIVAFLILAWIFFPDMYFKGWNLTVAIVDKIFNDWVEWIFAVLLIFFFNGGNFYGAGYGSMKRNYLRGTQVCLFGMLNMISGVILLIHFTAFTILFTHALVGVLKLVLIVIFGLSASPILILALQKYFDISTFARDLFKQRKLFTKISYTVEGRGKKTYIHLDVGESGIESIFEPVALVKMQEIFYLIKQHPSEAINVHIKSGLLFIIPELLRLVNAYPRAKNRILRRFAKMKIGRNVTLSQFTRIDPLFPDLIEFEDGSGCGIGCVLLTHNFMDHD